MILRNWTENRALRASNARFNKVKELLGEVACLWGDVDEYAVGRCDELIRVVEDIRTDIVLSAQARAEERETE